MSQTGGSASGVPRAISAIWVVAASPLTPGRDFAGGKIKLAAWSLVGTLFFLYFGAITFPGGAFQFADYTTALVQGRGAPHLFARDIGYPLLLIGTGYLLTYSFAGVLLAQAAMAWAMPLLVYALLGRGHRVAAYYAGLATILSMAPYLFMTMIHHDQAYIFLSLVTAYWAVRYLTGGRRRDMYIAVVALVLTALTRPAGNLLALPLLMLFMLLRPANWRHYVAGATIVVLCATAYAAHRSALFADIPKEYSRSYAGRQIFYNVYVNSADFGVRVDSSAGPANSRLFAKARALLQTETLAGEGPILADWYRVQNFTSAARIFSFGRFAGQDDRFINELTAHPSHDYFEFFCLVERDDAVFLEAAREIAAAHPDYLLRVALRNLKYFLWSPGYAHGRFRVRYEGLEPEQIYFLPMHPDVAASQVRAFVPSPAREQLLAPDPAYVRHVRTLVAPLEEAWKRMYHPVNQVTLTLAVLALLGALCGLPRSTRPAVLVLWLMLLYNAVVTCTFAEPNYRYHFFQLTLQIGLAGCGLAAMDAIWRRVIGRHGACADSANAPSDPGHLGRVRQQAWLALLLVGILFAAVWTWQYTTRAAGQV